MKGAYVFGGAEEGREVCAYLAGAGIPVTLSVTTAYGKELAETQPGLVIHTGAMEWRDIAEAIQGFDCVIDATHPYAQMATDNITKAAKHTNIPCFRLIRQTVERESGLYFPSLQAIVSYLEKREGRILLTIGSKEVAAFATLPGFAQRCFVRLLPTVEAIQKCTELGFLKQHIIAVQGPFSERWNRAMLAETQAKFLVTKDSGELGGFSEKREAAKKEGASLLIWGREEEEGLTFEELKAKLQSFFPALRRRRVTFIGVGMGPSTVTKEGAEAMARCDCLIGAKRLLEPYEGGEKPLFCSANKEEIGRFAASHTEYLELGVLLSGDVGFYSGAASYEGAFPGFQCKRVAGVSSVSYLCSKLGIPWEDTLFASLHGRKEDVLPQLLTSRKLFVLAGTGEDIATLCQRLCQWGRGAAQVAVGENLASRQERITVGSAEELQRATFSPLSAALFLQDLPLQPSLPGIADELWLRGKTPMTKEEVRCISLCKLHLKQQEILYDIGAGTGSVSIEASKHCGWVYAIEKDSEAVQWIDKNITNFDAANVTIIRGEAPTALEGLPPPDAVFIGGSAGKMEDIIKHVLKRNATVRIVCNAILLETAVSVMKTMEEQGIQDCQTVQVQVAVGKKVGTGHMMLGQNPIFIVSGTGAGNRE